jgi:PilZ domain
MEKKGRKRQWDMQQGTVMGSNSFGSKSSNERRESARFPMREDLKYRLLQSKNHGISGSGTTLNIGSGGILFTTEEMLPVGRTIELSVNWPARIDGTCALKFVAVGRVIRAEADRAAVRIERYEFKTRGAGDLLAHPSAARAS